MLMDRAQSSQNFQLLNYWDFGSKKKFHLELLKKWTIFIMEYFL